MRWRNVKQKKFQKPKPKEKKTLSIFLRIKAFIIDTFMIYIPILYFTTYVILGSKEAFLENQFAIFIDIFLFGFILTIFFSIKGQSPGYKAYEIELIDMKTEKRVKFLKAFWRYFCFLIAGASVVGLFLCFFREDRLNLHDILSKTKAIKCSKK